MHCSICGQPLIYLTKERKEKCFYCKQEKSAYVVCPENHFVCDDCHGNEIKAALKQEAFKAQTPDPIKLSLLWLKKYPFPMLGCEHAYLAASSLLGSLVAAGFSLSKGDLEEVFSRIDLQARGGFCGLTGICGIVPALGASLAILNSSHCGTDREQREVMELTSDLLKKFAELTGPSCCKAYLWAGLEVVTKRIKAFYPQVNLRTSSPLCFFSKTHPHGCRQEKCPYFNTFK
ncbi:DUF5714 domain-containing protein [Thermosulfurimonas dismutans]|uniref:Methyltransferase n=1 Tax=Thermosulfurimonas dismutans TaxID=999894 RepID=A0A179D786_9BACT|nr:DUF5714 domain-containing protein [Thermosulfurimonas dismutans]OAQ21651.1 Methyltransferase [Thermosulfurimonas dismutans]